MQSVIRVLDHIRDAHSHKAHKVTLKIDNANGEVVQMKAHK